MEITANSIIVCSDAVRCLKMSHQGTVAWAKDYGKNYANIELTQDHS